jgi:ribose 5-phosphate isomerase B
MTIGIAADHGGYELKNHILKFLTAQGYDVQDYGAFAFDNLDDYPDLILPLAKVLQQQKIERAIAICGSGVGACVAANKVIGVRACLITEHFSAHQGVEDDDMNMLCLGGRVTGTSAAEEITLAFLQALFKTEEKYIRRLNKVKAEEQQNFDRPQ